MNPVFDVWREVVRLFLKRRVLLVPFLAVAFLELGAIVVLAYQHLTPLAAVFSPPIRHFWGEAFLHYPYHLLVLPRLLGYIEPVIAVAAGLVMTGVAIRMIGRALSGARSAWKEDISLTSHNYMKFLGIWILLAGLIQGIFSVGALLIRSSSAFGHAGTVLTVLTMLGCFLVSMVVQVLFIYSIPVVIFEGATLAHSLRRGFYLGRRLFFTTLVLTVIPTLPYLLFHCLNGYLPQLVQRFFPEVVLVVLSVGILLRVFADMMVTSSTAVLYLKNQGHAQT